MKHFSYLIKKFSNVFVSFLVNILCYIGMISYIFGDYTAWDHQQTSGFLMFLWGIVSVNLDNFVSIKMIHQKATENLPFLYNPFMHNDEKWSNIVWILQCEHCLIFNVCLTIFHHSACKGQGNSFFREIFFIFLYQYFSHRIAGDCYWNAFSRKYLDHIKRM